MSNVDTKVKSFYDSVKEGKLLASRCRNCKRFCFPPRAGCPECYSFEVSWEPIIPKEGVLLTYTQITSAPESFEKVAPYSVGIVEIKDGLKLVGWLETNNIKEIRPGMRVQIFTSNFADGRSGVMFVPH